MSTSDLPPVVIMDVDGTLANAQHRQHLLPIDLCIQSAVADGSLIENPAWQAFLAAAVHDRPNPEIVALSNAMSEHALVFVVTGRGAEHRQMTEAWLLANKIHFDRLYMRGMGDRWPDPEVKREILKAIRAEGFAVLFAVEDRASVTAMWRENGVRCLQVCEGNY